MMMIRLPIAALAISLLAMPPPAGADDGLPRPGPATLSLEEIATGLEKGEKAWRGQQSWLVRYRHTRVPINSKIPFHFTPMEITNARKGGRLFASVARAGFTVGVGLESDPDPGHNTKLWFLWMDGLYTERQGDSVCITADPDDGMLSNMISQFLYPSNLNFHVHQDALPEKGRKLLQGDDDMNLARLFRDGWAGYRVRKDLEDVEGFACHVVEAPDRDVVWIDPKHGFAARRRDRYFPSGPLFYEAKAMRFRERGPGVWLPEEQVLVTYNEPEAAGKDRGVQGPPGRVFRIVTNILEEARFNDVPDDLFRVPTEGAKVLDLRDAKPSGVPKADGARK